MDEQSEMNEMQQSEMNEMQEQEAMDVSDAEKEIIATEKIINAMFFYRKYAARKFGFSYFCLRFAAQH